MVILILFLKINMVPLKTHYKVLEIETDLNWVSQINGILSLNNFFFFLLATILPSWQLKRQQKGKKKHRQTY